MTISIGFDLDLQPKGQGVAPALPTITSIAPDGWQATYDGVPPAQMDPVGAPETVVVTRQGFDATGATSAPSDVLTLMKRMRRPYPDHASLTTDQIALSDVVYGGDTINGVANSSTRAYPKPVCCWLTPDRQIAESNSVTLRLAVAHMYARAGRPVAAVKFLITDGSTTLGQTISTMSTHSFSASGLTVPHFAQTFDTSGFAAGAALTVDAVIYPWVGAAYQASVDGGAYPTINFTTLRVYTPPALRPIAYVDPVNGSNTTGVASYDDAAAGANPFLTMNIAVQSITALTGTNAGGGIVNLRDGTHNFYPIKAHAGTVTLPLRFVGESAAGTIIVDRQVSTASSLPQHTRFETLTLQRGGPANVIMLDNAAGLSSANTVVFDDVTLDTNGHGAYAGFIYRTGRFWLISCTGNMTGLVGSIKKEPQVIGCANTGAGFNMIGSINSGFSDAGLANAGRDTANGIFVGWNVMSAANTASTVANFALTVGAAGLAIIGNVIEDIDGATSPALWINADGNNNPAENVIVQCNTVAGQRVNILYNDTNAAAKTGAARFNIFRSFNNKSDVFAANGTHVGNWSAIHHVGFRANAFIGGGDDGSTTFGTGNWVGEIGALGEEIGSVPDFTDDASASGTGLGGGDYTPGASNDLPVIPAGFSPYPVDQMGRAIAGDGSALIGAMQQP